MCIPCILGRTHLIVINHRLIPIFPRYLLCYSFSENHNGGFFHENKPDWTGTSRNNNSNGIFLPRKGAFQGFNLMLFKGREVWNLLVLCNVNLIWFVIGCVREWWQGSECREMSNYVVYSEIIQTKWQTHDVCYFVCFVSQSSRLHELELQFYQIFGRNVHRISLLVLNLSSL